MKCLIFITCIIALINQGFSIRITRFVMPTVASVGAVLDLDCAYDLESDQLYDVKWYKDSNEFFRCKPDGYVQAFEIKDIKLYHNQQATLGSCPVTMTILSNKSAGHYRCEISTEAPEFKTTARSVLLRISNIQPSRRIQNNGSSTSTPTESSTQQNGNEGAIISKASFTYIIFLYFVINYLKINFIWF